MNKFVNWILGFILVVMSIMVCWLSVDLRKTTKELVEVTNLENEIVFLESVEFDTIYLTKTEIVRLPIYNTDTIKQTDTLTLVEIDSVDVEIPISTYHYDTTLAETHISLICEGFDVVVDTLLVQNLKYCPTQEKQAKRWGIGLGIGATYCDGFKLLPMIGISYNLFQF